MEPRLTQIGTLDEGLVQTVYEKSYALELLCVKFVMQSLLATYDEHPGHMRRASESVA
jgi:hypothetical protein